MKTQAIALSTAIAALALSALAAPTSASPFVALSSLGGTITTWAPNDDCTFPNADSGSGCTTSGGTAQSMGISLNFFGNTYSNAFINNNGNITFDAPLQTYTPFGLTGTGQVIVAPFFADVDTRGTDGNGAGNSVLDFTTGATYAGHTAFGVEWPGVGYYGQKVDKLNTFQLIIVDRSDLDPGDADIYFNYGAIEWETGDASGGTEGLGGSCATAGFSNGTGAPGTSFDIPGSGNCGALLDGGPNALISSTNDGTPGQWLFQVRNGSVIVPTTVPEPATLTVLGLGLASLGLMRRKRKV